MPSLNDLLGKARLPTPSGIRKDITGQINAAIKSTSNEVRNIPAGIANQALISARGTVAEATNAGLSAVRGAVTKAISGDFSGALTQLAQGPQDALGKFGAAFGLSSAGGSLTGGGSAVNTLQGALDRADPVLSFQWYCDLPAVAPVGGTPVQLGWNYVEEVQTAFRNFDVRAVYAQGRNRHYASTYSLDNLNLTFYADIANQSINYLQAWEGAILAPFSSQNASRGGGFGRPGGYKKPIKVYLVAPNKSLVLTLEYIECWPTNTASLQLNSDSSNRLTFNVPFSCGDVFVEAFGINNNVAGGSLLNRLALNVGESILSI